MVAHQWAIQATIQGEQDGPIAPGHGDEIGVRHLLVAEQPPKRRPQAGYLRQDIEKQVGDEVTRLYHRPPPGPGKRTPGESFASGSRAAFTARICAIPASP